MSRVPGIAPDFLPVLVYPIRQAGNDWEYLLLHRVGGRGSFWQGATDASFEGETLVCFSSN